MSVNRQISDDNGYSADENTEYLEKHDLGGPYLHESSQEKRGFCPKNNFKDNFIYNYEMMMYICFLAN